MLIKIFYLCWIDVFGDFGNIFNDFCAEGFSVDYRVGYRPILCIQIVFSFALQACRPYQLLFIFFW